MLLYGSSANRQYAWVGMIGHLLLGVELIGAIVHVLKLEAVGRQDAVLTANGLADAETGQEATRLQQAQELTDVLLQRPWTFVMVLKPINAAKNVV